MQSNSSTTSRLIIFDMDGTLFNTETAFIPAVQEFVTRYGLPVPDREFSLHFCGEPIHVFIDWIAGLKIDRPLGDLIAEFDVIELEMTEQRGELYDKIPAVLDYLHQQGYRLAICSNGTERYISRVISRFQLGSYFSDIALPRFKGETKSMLIAGLLKDIHPEFAVMIGDRKHDFLAAKENGIPSIGMRYGYGGDELLLADYLAEEPLVIPALLLLLEEKR